jgi:hypothetical protein
MKVYARKGQAALEFMMTYGWAILVVLAAIGALSYFGILNPSKFTPDTCLASSGFACPGKPLVSNDTITFSIVNGLGYKVDFDNDTTILSSTLGTACPTGTRMIYFCKQGEIDCMDTDTMIVMDGVEDGGGVTVRLEGCSGLSELNVVKGELKFSYKNPNSKLDETLIVSVTGKNKENG